MDFDVHYGIELVKKNELQTVSTTFKDTIYTKAQFIYEISPLIYIFFPIPHWLYRFLKGKKTSRF